MCATRNKQYTSFKLLTVNYYDNYTMPNVTTATSVEGQTVATSTKGLLTGSWTRIATTAAETKGETSYILYDAKYHPIRSFTTNYLGGYTCMDSKLDSFSGQLQYTVQKHKRTPADSELTVKEVFTYSTQDRLIKHTHQINGGAEQLLAENTYDELGQLMSKKVGNSIATPLQKVDYSYNSRGWMKSINNPTALQQGSDPADLFGFKLNYNTVEGSVAVANKLYNGNIAETFWSTATDGGFVRNYGYKYDNLNRLKDATYQKSSLVTGMYNENLTYDKNSNIMTLKRNGDNDAQAGTIGIDNLSYGYLSNSNKLMSVVDSSNNTSGFNDFNKTGDDYSYDANGNMSVDKNKKITSIVYNHLNLPTKIVFGTTGSISYVYSATGQKAEKMVTQGTTITTTNYLNVYLYKNGVLQYFPTAEGYVEHNRSSFKYVFQYKDHLGNVRLSYTKNITTNTLDIIEENNYYPFGLRHAGYNTTIVGGVTEAQKVKFGSKEYQNELNLNVYDFGARVYNPEGGPAFWQIDPKAEQMRRWSPYSYAFNNPIRFIDPDGMAPTDWIEFTGTNGQQQIVYDSSVKTKEQAEAAGYKNVKQVFEEGKGKSKKTGEVINFQKDGNYSVNGGKPLNVDDNSYTTKGGTYIGENKGGVDAIGDFGPEALQKGGDTMLKGAGVAALSGAEPVAAVLATVGSTMSGIGAVGKIINDGVEGKFDVKNFAIQATSEVVNFYFKKFSGDNTLNSIMLQNGVSEVGKGMEELNKK